MTEIDVRLAYHRDTGCHALWETEKMDGSPLFIYGNSYGRNVRVTPKTWLFGVPTSDYGRWMEEQLVGIQPGNLRLKYEREEGKTSSYNVGKDRKRREILCVDYGRWLEQKMLTKMWIEAEIEKMLELKESQEIMEEEY
jgi:hypothetical protein